MKGCETGPNSLSSLFEKTKGRFTRYDFRRMRQAYDITYKERLGFLRHDLRLARRSKTCFKMLRHFFRAYTTLFKKVGNAIPDFSPVDKS